MTGGENTRADCPFCRIALGEVEGYVVWQEAHTLAFLDARPLFLGHCLVVPRGHYETLADLPQALLHPLLAAVQCVAQGVERGMGADGTLVAINNRVSQSVPHLHVHVIPRRRGDGLKGFFWPRQQYESEAQRAAVQEAIRRAIAALHGE